MTGVPLFGEDPRADGAGNILHLVADFRKAFERVRNQVVMGNA